MSSYEWEIYLPVYLSPCMVVSWQNSVKVDALFSLLFFSSRDKETLEARFGLTIMSLLDLIIVMENVRVSTTQHKLIMRNSSFLDISKYRENVKCMMNTDLDYIDLLGLQ